jgi:hypothetical protein
VLDTIGVSRLGKVTPAKVSAIAGAGSRLTQEEILTSEFKRHCYYNVRSCVGQYKLRRTVENNKLRRKTKIKSGRPPKFRGPRRPVTVTLPESTLARLASIDPDRARAIVKLTDAAIPLDAKQQKPIELVEVAPGLAIIIVGPSKLLQNVKCLRLVEVAPMRFLLSIPLGTSIDSLELAVIELLEDAKEYDDWDHSLLSELRDLIRSLRRRGEISKAEMLFVDTRAMGGETDAEPS